MQVGFSISRWITFTWFNLFFSLQNTFEQWRPVFFVGASVYIISALFFLFFGTSETQSWNYPENKEGKEKDGEIREMNGVHVKNGDVTDVKETPLSVVT